MPDPFPQLNKFSLDIELQSISFSQSPYLETQDGKRYTIGAILNESYTIKEITREFILLSKDGWIRVLLLQREIIA